MYTSLHMYKGENHDKTHSSHSACSVWASTGIISKQFIHNSSHATSFIPNSCLISVPAYTLISLLITALYNLYSSKGFQCSALFMQSLSFHFLPNNCFLCCSSKPSRWSALFCAALNWSLNWVTTSSFFTMACFTLMNTYALHYITPR